jgi:hypothetical protein
VSCATTTVAGRVKGSWFFASPWIAGSRREFAAAAASVVRVATGRVNGHWFFGSPDAYADWPRTAAPASETMIVRASLERVTGVPPVSQPLGAADACRLGLDGCAAAAAGCATVNRPAFRPIYRPR